MSNKQNRLLRSAIGAAICCSAVSAALLVSSYTVNQVRFHDSTVERSIEGTSLLTGIASEGYGKDIVTSMLFIPTSELNMSYAIVVDGTAVCTSDDQEVLSEALSSILKRYMDSNTVSAEFKEDVSIKYIPANDSLNMNMYEIISMLDSENPEAGHGLTVVTTSSESTVEVIPYNTEYIYDETKYSDESELIRQGTDGVRLDKYTIYSENGKTVSTVKTSSSVIASPINEAISVGTIEGSRCDSKGCYIWPTDGTISSYFGYRVSTIGSSNHMGIDIANSLGTDIYAADGGTVIYAGLASGYGNLIKIQHDNGDVTYYGHLSKILVSVDDKVAQGDLIAQMGSTGVSTGPHLHFEIRIDGTAVDPLDYLE